MAERLDLIVIGSGPAGEKGALQAAHCGQRVVVVEKAAHLGGAGINSGTVPSKSLREAALYFSGLRQRGLYGIDYSLKEQLTVDDFMFRERQIVAAERTLIRETMERSGVTVLRGTASFEDAQTVRVVDATGEVARLQAGIVLIATGSSPRRPAGIPFDHRRVFDSDEILFEMDRIPRSMTVVGGGVIGCEYASIFAALDVQVTLIEGKERICSFVDGEIIGRLQARLEQLGMRFLMEERVDTVEAGDDEVRLRLGSGEEIVCDIALWAAGRSSNVEGLGLEQIGVATGERGLILVNEHYQTSVPSIYAAGDVIGFPALGSISMEQARVAMAHAFGLEYKQRVSAVQPLAVYTIPELAMVGLTEEECQAKGIPYLVGRAGYEKNARGQIIGDSSGMLKLIFSPEDKRLIGAHHIGEQASELVHIGAHALVDGATIDTFVKAVYNWPTLSEVYKYAANDGLDALDACALGKID